MTYVHLGGLLAHNFRHRELLTAFLPLLAILSACGDAQSGQAATDAPSTTLQCEGEIADGSLTYEVGAGEIDQESAARSALADDSLPSGEPSIVGPSEGVVLEDGQVIASFRMEELPDGWVVSSFTYCG